MLRNKNVLTICGYALLCAVTAYTCMGCFPTTADVNGMQAANQEFNKGLHDAGNKMMTEQHSAMTPELAEAFAVMQGQYDDLSAQLRARASETKAAGVSVGALGGESAGGGVIQWILGLFNLGWLYPFFKGFGKSRSSSEVAKATADILDLKLNLATKAGANEKLPG